MVTHSLWIDVGVKEVIVEVSPRCVHHGNPRPERHCVCSNAHVLITFSLKCLEIYFFCVAVMFSIE